VVVTRIKTKLIVNDLNIGVTSESCGMTPNVG